MKKRFSAYRLLPMLSLLSLLLVLTACGGEDLSSQEDEPTVLVYGTFSDQYADHVAVRCFDQYHSEIAVEIRNYSEYADGVQQLRFSQGRQLLELWGIQDFTQISRYNERFEAALGSPCVFVGFPVEDGSVGSYFGVSGTRFAMNAASGNKEAAWAFIRETFLPKYEGGLDRKRREYVEAVRGRSSHGLPVNRADFETRQKSALKGWEAAEGSSTSELAPMTQEEMDRFMEFYNSIRRTNLSDNTIFDLVMEQSRPYFAGDLTLDETVERIQNRVTLYVNERR